MTASLHNSDITVVPEQQSLKLVIPPTPGELITSLKTGVTYTIGNQIGEGHFGVVYECTDVWNNELAAKVLKPIGTYEDVKQKAEQEFFKLLTVRCPYITYIYDAFEFRDTFYLITERCHDTLDRLFRIDNFNGRIWILPIARCILQAIHYLHLSGLVHQDIHLGNVFVSFEKDEMTGNDNSSMHFKLADLGVAKLMEQIDATNTRAQWMLPPEILEPNEFGPINHKTDIYHTGLLLLQVALGRQLQFTQEEIVEGKPREMALELAPPLNFALEKTLRRHASFRTETAMELWRDLNTSPQLQEPTPDEQQKAQQ
jgi:serine/threonine-protein kinase